MKLIDADALREHMYHEAFETDSGLQKWDSGLWIRYQMFESILNTEITVDAEPIKHGKGVIAKESRVTVWLECSVCHKPIDVEDKYCRHCGAKMDRGDL